ncbi:glycosyltransferase family 4 protein [Microbacterium sp. AZCO]|uniref:glycosyltransferase family 4 protein n=1 Tax=Microbacterium sp. AZCO TaxID=3142976 RepID=UPI0031F3FA2B
MDDLASELVRQGHEVDVVVADATHPGPRGFRDGSPDGLRVFSVGPEGVRPGAAFKLLAYLAMGWRLHTHAPRALRKQYDLGVYTSIASFTWGLPARLRRSGRIRRLMLVLWDFFPVHQLEIGRIRAGWAAAPMKAIEKSAIVDADVVALMSDANVRFFRSYFGLGSETIVLPPWSSSGSIDDAPGRWRASTLRVLWGGQIARGRGLDVLLDAARILEADPATRESVEILIAGDGPERERMQNAARDLGIVRFLGALPRDDFRRLLASAHLGMAITVEGVSVPTFPSKIVEYSGAGLPSLVCIESASDVRDLVMSRGIGLVAPADDPEAIATQIRAAYAELRQNELERRSTAARAFWADELSVEHAARTISTAPGATV